MKKSVAPKAAPIHTLAMLVSLSLSSWTARKFSEKISSEVARKHGASADAGRYTKNLLPKQAAPAAPVADGPEYAGLTAAQKAWVTRRKMAEGTYVKPEQPKTYADSYHALTSLLGSIRQQHYEQTLAWSDDGWRLLPTSNYMEYAAFTRKAEADLDAAKAAFLKDYPDMREAAKALLNGMYSDDDYPDLDELRERFSMKVDFAPLPAEGDFRCSLPAADLKRIEAETAERIQSAVGDAMKDAWTRLYQVVEKIAERCTDSDLGTRSANSMIDNAKEVCDVLKRLNVTGDPNLERMRSRVENELASLVPAAIVDRAKTRTATARQAADILAAMRATFPQEN